MYPNLYYAFKDLFGVEIPGLEVFKTFGFFVALAFLAAAYVLTSELRRREKLGLLHPVPEKSDRRQTRVDRGDHHQRRNWFCHRV